MKISALEIDGFGVWTGLKMHAMSDKLNVFYGPNEAGKTTLMQFIRAVLYGFSEERRHYLPPVHGGRPGGTLDILGPNGVFRASRYFDADLDPAEELMLFAPDGSRQGEHVLPILLSSIDEKIFNNVFAVGLHELQELATLNGTEAASLLYNLSAGLDRVSLIDVMRELGSSRTRLLAPDGSPSQIPQLLGQRDRLTAEIEELGTLSRRYGRLVAEREQLDQEAERFDQDSRQVSDQLRAVEIAMTLRDRWQKRRALDDQLAAIGPKDAIPHGAMSRLDGLQRIIDDRQSRFDEARKQRDELRKETVGLKVNKQLWRQSPRIEALREQGDWYKTLESRAAELAQELAVTETEFEKHRSDLGFTGKQLPVVSPQSLAALQRPARAVGKARRRLEDLQQQAQQAHQTAESLGDHIRETLESGGQQNLPEATENLGGLIGRLRRRQQIDQRLEQMEQHHAELDQQCQELIDRQMLSASALWLVGAVFVVGMFLVLGAPLKFFAWPWAVLGAGVIATAVYLKASLERSHSRQLDQCQKQLKMLQLQQRQAIEERDSLDRALPHAEGPVGSRLQAAERELAGIEELVPVDARRLSARQEAEMHAANAKQAEQDLASAKRRWKESIAAAGLPEGLAPRQVRELAARYDQLRDLRDRVDRRREELQQRRGELNSLVARIAELARDCGLDAANRSPLEQLELLASALTQQEMIVSRRATLRHEARRIRRNLSRDETALVRSRRRRRLLLDELGVHDEDDFRRRAEDFARVDELRRQRESVQREIEAAIAGFCPEETIAQLLDSTAGAGLESRREQFQNRLAGYATQLKQRFEKRGQIAEQLRSLAEDRTPARKHLELALVQNRLDESLRRWKVLAVTHQVLEGIRKTYERSRQPETLQEASSYLQRLTQGRYRRIWTPLSDDILWLDDSEGHPHAVDALSRGVREQLFLSLRLALAASYARRGAQLPMVLDDVLVNFDTSRAKAAAEVLRDFAESGHQTLVFTCHEHVARIFESLHVGVYDLPSAAHSHVTISLAPRTAKPKRKRVAAVEVAPEVAPPPPRPEPARPAAKRAAKPAFVAVFEELAPWEEDEPDERFAASADDDRPMIGTAVFEEVDADSIDDESFPVDLNAPDSHDDRSRRHVRLDAESEPSPHFTGAPVIDEDDDADDNADDKDEDEPLLVDARQESDEKPDEAADPLVDDEDLDEESEPNLVEETEEDAEGDIFGRDDEQGIDDEGMEDFGALEEVDEDVDEDDGLDDEDDSDDPDDPDDEDDEDDDPGEQSPRTRRRR